MYYYSGILLLLLGLASSRGTGAISIKTSRSSGGLPPVQPPAPGGAPHSQQMCTPKLITIPECRHLFYNYTGMPNLVGQENQMEAYHQLQTFNPLISYQCSVKLRFFLCSVYTPMCDINTHYLIGPCRPLCEHVRERCNPVLRAFDFEWPANLNCSRFPVRNTPATMCMDGPHLVEDGPQLPGHPSDRIGGDYDRSRSGGGSDPDRRRLGNSRGGPSSKFWRSKCGYLKNWDKYVYINRTGMCALRCTEDDLFTQEDKYIAEVWMGILSGLCFVSTLFTVLTFLIDSHRFKYPERPVVFLAMCYNIYSISYFVRLIAGREQIVCDRDAASGQQILIQEGLDNTDCAITFLIQYFFGTASSVWWVMLTVTWVLAAGFKWGDEAIQRRSCYLHVTAWLVPSVLTVVVLVMRAVDADELLGVCSVGQQRTATLMGFVIAPNLTFLLLGSFCLMAGFIALLRIRRHVKSDGIKTDKLEVLMVRIGLFSLLYIVPAACVTGCNIYEYIYRAEWHSPRGKHSPNIEVFMLKTFMSLVVGITSGVWIWSVKTLQSWRSVCDRLVQRRDAIPLDKERVAMVPANAVPGGGPTRDNGGAQSGPPGIGVGPVGGVPTAALPHPPGFFGPHSSLGGSGRPVHSSTTGQPPAGTRLPPGHFNQYDAKYSKASHSETVI